MLNSYNTPAREFTPGMGQAVADRTITRKKEDGSRETWAEVAHRVALGNSMLTPAQETEGKLADASDQIEEFHALHHHLRQASILMSGRHLQHGDETQPTRPGEVFTNCSTSALRAVTFYLLLNGSGVGEDFSNDMMLVDWSKMPTVVPVINWGHKDRDDGRITGFLTRAEAEHLYKHVKVTVYEVPDSREGWALAVAKMEIMAFQGRADEVLILDFSGVRPNGAPIGGMQGRPASGPGPLMQAIRNITAIKSSQMARWRQHMYVSHYLAECVLVGGARRAARMATKNWKDLNVLDFIEVKRGGYLWSANNSVTVDDEFWAYVKMYDSEKALLRPDEDFWCEHAKKVLDRIAHCSYHDGTGEPGIINQHRLTEKREGLEDYLDGQIITGGKLQLPKEYLELTKALTKVVVNKKNVMITNPCSEVPLTMLGGYCVIADVVPYHARSLDDAIDAFRTAARALIRTNLMDFLYRREVDRTNRIGVGLTGLHEFAWKFFKIGFHDMINPDFAAYEKKHWLDIHSIYYSSSSPVTLRAASFWHFLSLCKLAVQREAEDYSNYLGVTIPHTDTIAKPSGTVSKLFSLTEGVHLPAMAEYLRWVQFRNDDPLVQDYKARGYPTRELKSYSGTTIVGFPTETEICRLGMGDKLVTAAEATPEEQYEYLRLLEKFWLTGEYCEVESGGQLSYTLKYDPKVVDFETFKRTLIEGQSTIRCCSVMPQVDGTAYEYQPEQSLTRAEYDELVSRIEKAEKEDIGREHVDCESGACPISFNENK